MKMRMSAAAPAKIAVPTAALFKKNVSSNSKMLKKN